MSFKCNIGIHDWDGCTCKNCGKIRDDHHDLSVDCEKCSKCGQVINDNHDWSHDCEKCFKCGKTREDAHSWSHDCEKCSDCGKTRIDKHQMENGMCTVCGHGVFNDADGKVYQIVKIAGQVIMAQNYAKKPAEGNFWAYEDDEENAKTFGYLYDWETAKKLTPKGWHLPTKEEWERVFQSLGGHSKEVYDKMKAGGNSDFEARLGGWRYVKGVYNGKGASSHYWSDTSKDENHAWNFKLVAYGHHAEFETGEKGLGLSVRYFKDR